MSEWTLGAVLDAIADVIPDRLMTVCGDAYAGPLVDELRVALIALADKGTDLTREPLHSHCVARLAGFKVPKEFIVVEQVRRLGNGKADYRWAKSAALREATPA
jgi:acyl-CoA synthetase (AMP-forming)/AMP-acid ligase II